MADKCSEVEYTSGASCNEEMTREKSVRRKQGVSERRDNWARKSQADPTWLRLRLRRA